MWYQHPSQWLNPLYHNAVPSIWLYTVYHRPFQYLLLISISTSPIDVLLRKIWHWWVRHDVFIMYWYWSLSVSLEVRICENVPIKLSESYSERNRCGEDSTYATALQKAHLLPYVWPSEPQWGLDSRVQKILGSRNSAQSTYQNKDSDNSIRASCLKGLLIQDFGTTNLTSSTSI